VLILALDTTSRAGSVAVVQDTRVLVETAGDEAMVHGQRLPVALQDACEAAGISIEQIACLAVAAGPGSFTGLRIGIATMQGLAMARDLRIVPVSTLEATAAAAPGAPERVAAWIDAHRGEVFAQVFVRTARGMMPEVEAMAAGPATVLAAHAAALHGARFHGDGAARYAEAIHAVVPDAPVAQTVPPLAAAIGLIAGAQPDRAVRPHAVVPIYVRRPDVEVERERRSTTT
jgi:tRNA threonylcarbamoyladenosine biosynthesis protein TsaB